MIINRWQINNDRSTISLNVELNESISTGIKRLRLLIRQRTETVKVSCLHQDYVTVTSSDAVSDWCIDRALDKWFTKKEMPSISSNCANLC